MQYLRGAILSQYEAQGLVRDANCAIGLSFGDSTHDTSVNAYLAKFLGENAGDKPMIVDEALRDSFLDWMPEPALVIPCVMSSPFRSGRSTASNLRYAAGYMKENGLETGLLVVHRNLAGRAAMQGAGVGLELVVPADLPGGFDSQAKHIWPRSRSAWIAHELLAYPLLKLRGQL